MGEAKEIQMGCAATEMEPGRSATVQHVASGINLVLFGPRWLFVLVKLSGRGEAQELKSDEVRRGVRRQTDQGDHQGLIRDTHGRYLAFNVVAWQPGGHTKALAWN